MNLQGTSHAYTKTIERKSNLLFRNRHGSALALLKPLFQTPEPLTSANLYRAISLLHKTFPDLSGNEIEAMLEDVMRAFKKRKTNLE